MIMTKRKEIIMFKLLIALLVTCLSGSLYYNYIYTKEKCNKDEKVIKQLDTLIITKNIYDSNKVVFIIPDTIKPKEIKIIKHHKTRRLLSGFTKVDKKDTFNIIDIQTTNIVDSINIKPRITIKKH